MQSWVIRPYPHRIPRMREFIAGGFIAVGWPNIGDYNNLDKPGLMRRLQTVYKDRDAKWFGRSVATLLRFRDEMANGDLVIVAPKKAETNTVSLARIIGPVSFDPQTDGTFFGYPHHRPVRWLIHDVVRETLPTENRLSLKSQGTLFRTPVDILVPWAEQNVPGGLG